MDARTADSGDSGVVDMDDRDLNDGGSTTGDLGETDSGVPDAGDTCGDGTVQDDELCDGDTVACEELATSYVSGTATCRPGCEGYDVSNCTRTAEPVREYVKPALRDAERWGEAQCSVVGAPFFFTVVLTGSSRWHITLEGGGFCSNTNVAPCYDRPGSLTRDVEVRDEGVVTVEDGEFYGNISPTAHPDSFATANQVQLQYCSNDIWTGTRLEPVDIPDGAGSTMPFRYTGRLNVRATLEMLIQRFGMNDDDPDLRVFLTGNSAGGLGTMNNVDQLATLLPNTAAAGRLHAVARAGAMASEWGAEDADVAGDWSLRTLNGTPTGRYLEDAAPILVSLYQAKFASICEAAYSESERWRCVFAHVQTPYLTDPAPDGLGLNVAIIQNVTDPYYLAIHGILTQGGAGYAYAPEGGEAAATAYGDQLAAALSPLRWVYAPRHPLRFHGIPMGLQPEDENVPTFGAVIDSFVLSNDPPPFNYVDFGPFALPD